MRPLLGSVARYHSRPVPGSMTGSQVDGGRGMSSTGSP